MFFVREVELVALRQVAPRPAAQRNAGDHFQSPAERGLVLSQRDKTHLWQRKDVGKDKASGGCEIFSDSALDVRCLEIEKTIER